MAGSKTYFTEASVSRYRLPSEGQQADYFERLRRGLTLMLRVSYGGTKAWRVCYYVNGQQRAKTLGHYPELWTLHDLRRTARSLMAKAGIAGNIAERVLGHAIAGIEGVYDRHDYFEEKAQALARLAKLIEEIVDPPDRANVLAISDHR